MRIRHDLLGCANRLRQTVTDYREMLAEVNDHWNDVRAQQFQREDLHDVDATIELLISQLHQVCETLNDFNKQLQDPDAS